MDRPLATPGLADRDRAGGAGGVPHRRRALSQCLAGGQATGTLPADLNALAIYEARLKESRSWPCNTAMLRTLVLSVLVPVVPVVGRYLLDALSR